MNADFVLSATIALKDNFTAQVNKAKSGFRDFERSLRGASATIDSTAASMEKSGLAAVKLSQQADRAKRSLTGIRGVYSATVRAKDEATQAVRRIKTELSGLQGKAYTAIVNIRQNGPLQQMRNGLSGMAGGMLMGTSMQMAGAAGIGFGVYDAVKGYMDFEKEMSAVKAISGATEQEFQQLTAKAQQMGADTKFSAFEAAQALEYMGMAGWKTNEMLNGLPGIMNLAAASGEDLASVSDIVTDALSAFKLQASDAAMFSDVLAAAATNSNTNVGKMGYTFKYVAPLAGAMGYSIQDTALAIGAMADSGIKAETAGTSLRAVLTRMAAPPKDAAEAMKQLGLSITRADGTMRPLRDILSDLRIRFRTLTPDQQAATAAALAGQDAMSGLLAIVNESDDKWNKLADAIDHSRGAAEKMAKTRMDNLAGDIEYLAGDWDAFTQMLLSGEAASGLRSFVQGADRVLTAFSDSVRENGMGVTSVLTGIGTAFTNLKDKALAMDGIGSVLAGGALVIGLTKIVNLARRARNYLGELSKPAETKIPGTGSGPGVNDMVVTAKTVIVNGTTAPGGSGPSVPPAGGKTPQQPAPKGPGLGSRIGTLASRAARWGIPLTMLNGVLEYAAAPEGQKGAAVGETIGNTAGWIAGAKGGAALGASIGASFGGIGAVPGAAVGGLIGGVAGSMAGGAAGRGIGGLDWDNEAQYANESLERISAQFAAKNQEWADAYAQSCVQMQAKGQEWETSIQQNLDGFANYMNIKTDEAKTFAVGCWDNEVQYASQSFDRISAQFAAKNQEWVDAYAQTCAQMQAKGQEWEDSIHQNLDGFASYMNLKTDEAKTFALGCWDTIATTAAEKNQQWAQSFDEAKNRAGQSLEALKTWASGVWDSLAQGASAAASSISAKLSGAWDAVQGAAPSFSFDVGSIFDHNATGSTHFAGGWTEINERGGEAIWLPNGSWIYPHATTEKIIRQQLAGLMTMPEPQDIQLQAPAITLPAPAAILQEISPQMPAITLPDMPQNMENPQQSSWQDIVQMPAVTPVVLDIPQAGSIEDNQPVDNTALIQPAEAAWAPLPGTARTSTEAAKQPASSDLRRAPAPQVTISGNTFMVREEADINRIAYELLKLMTTTNANFGGA